MLIEDQRAGWEVGQLGLLLDQPDVLVFEVVKERKFTQVQRQDTTPVDLVHACLVASVLEQLVQDIAEHFNQVAVTRGHDRGRAPRPIEAAHLAHELAGMQGRLSLLVVEVDGTVVGDVAAAPALGPRAPGAAPERAQKTRTRGPARKG